MDYESVIDGLGDPADIGNKEEAEATLESVERYAVALRERISELAAEEEEEE